MKLPAMATLGSNAPSPVNSIYKTWLASSSEPSYWWLGLSSFSNELEYMAQACSLTDQVKLERAPFEPSSKMLTNSSAHLQPYTPCNYGPNALSACHSVQQLQCFLYKKIAPLPIKPPLRKLHSIPRRYL